MILVTGATGFLGSELTDQLIKQGKNVRALKRADSVIPAALQHLAIEWLVADINDFAALEDAFENVTQVFHCAAMVSFNPADKARLLKINIEGTSNIVNLCHTYGARLMHVSSVAALGEPKKGMQITEKDFWEYDAKVNSYAISKYEGEMEVWRGIAEGLDAVIVNPSVIIGANAGFTGSGALFKLVKNGLKYYTDGATGFVDVRDVAESMITLMESDISAERFTISAENYHFKQFFSEIAAGFGMAPPMKEVKPWMISIAWRAAKVLSLFTGKTYGLTSEVAKSSTTTSFYSNEKIINTTGITFRPLSESIRAVCAGLIQQ